jgi:predicted nucleotidyltransferase
MAIDPKAVPALKTLAKVLAEEGRDFVLIGATVPQILIHFEEGVEYSGRTTRDVDAVVKAVSWEDFEGMRQRLFKAGFKPSPVLHRLLYDEDMMIDLIPYGSELVHDDHLKWPETDVIMSTLGVEEAFNYARQEEVASELSVRVVPIPVLVLLKIVAYMDRPEERARDLSDLVRCFEDYEEGNWESRRFEIGEVIVDDRPVEFEEAGAYLLGNEAGGLARPKSLVPVRALLDNIPDEYAGPIFQILKEEGRIVNSERRRRELLRLFRVFAAGLTEGAKS